MADLDRADTGKTSDDPEAKPPATREQIEAAFRASPEKLRETSALIADIKGQVPIYPGIDIDIPTALNEKRTQPSDVKAATLAALEAGAPGVVLSRKYAEMKLTNIAGARGALQDFGAL